MKVRMALRVGGGRVGEERSRRERDCRARRGFTLVELLAVMAILSLMSVSLFTMVHQGTETWRQARAGTEAHLKARQILDMMAREIRGAVLITVARGPDSEPRGERWKSADFRGLNGNNPGSGGSSNASTVPANWRKQQQDYSDQVYFVAPVTNSAEQDLCMIGYWVRDVEKDTIPPLIVDGAPEKSKDDALMRCYLTDQSKMPPSDEWMAFDFEKADSVPAENREVARGVRQLDVKYYDYVYTAGIPRLKEYNAWDSRPSSEGGTTSTGDDDNKLPVAVKITIAVGDENDVIKPIRLSQIVYLENARRGGSTQEW
jgi:prepilin-type N-terminal cleavage/methylation domain-containing protein